MNTAALKNEPKGLQPDLPFEAPPPKADDPGFETPDPREPKRQEPKVDPDVDALKRQVEDLKKSEEAAIAAAEAARAERQAALADRDSYETSLRKTQLSAEQAQLETIETAIGAAQAEADGAQRDITLAIEAGDAKAQAEAYRRLSRAESYLGRLEDGKADLETKVKATKLKADAPPPERKQADAIEGMNVPERAKEWLREHPEYSTNQRLNAKLQAAHWDALDEGHKAFSTDYFVAVEKIIGVRKPEPKEDEDIIEEREVVRPVTNERTPIVSAPVSREVPNGGEPRSTTKVRLTRDEAEAAKSAGITEAEYARQKIKLAKMKADGTYGG